MNIDILKSALSVLVDAPRAEQFAAPIAETLERFDITTQIRIGFFLPNAAHESQRLTRLEENMNYSARRLTQVFGNRVTPLKASQLQYKPVEIANYLYGGREGNNLENDGWDYRGSGIFGLTFLNNFKAVAEILGMPEIVSNPDIVRKDPLVAALTAGAFWHMNKLNAVADTGDFKALTRRINRGLVGWEERLKFLARVLPECGRLFMLRP